MLALGLECFLFLLLNIVVELLYDQDLPSAGETSSENILEVKDVTKYYLVELGKTMFQYIEFS